ncbi:7104_t:CDS:2, partial [Dentiscutata heterogama]
PLLSVLKPKDPLIKLTEAITNMVAKLQENCKPNNEYGDEISLGNFNSDNEKDEDLFCSTSNLSNFKNNPSDAKEIDNEFYFKDIEDSSYKLNIEKLENKNIIRLRSC